MINILKLLIVTALFVLSGCYAGMTGRVIDAETQQPLEGAIVLVEWTKTGGYPFSATTSVHAVEVVSDNDGKVELPGISDLFVNPPHVTVYKQGYVAWNDQFIFPPGYTERTDFKWENNYIFKMEKFKPGYSYDSHTSFLSSAIRTGSIEQKSNIMKAIRWEKELAFKERQINRVRQ